MTKIVFNRKPMPILAEYRPLYKISIILMVLFFSSRGKKSSLIRLQLITWAIKNKERHEKLLASIEKGTLSIDVWGIDPSLNISLQFSIAENLIARSHSMYTMTKYGKDYLNKIIESNIFESELIFLKELGLGLTEKMVEDRISRWET